jgi:hypothetical protein
MLTHPLFSPLAPVRFLYRRQGSERRGWRQTQISKAEVGEREAVTSSVFSVSSCKILHSDFLQEAREGTEGLRASRRLTSILSMAMDLRKTGWDILRFLC